METRSKGMRNAKEKSVVESKQLPNDRLKRKVAKNRIPLQDMPTNCDETELKMVDCTVVLNQLSSNMLEAPMHRLSQSENIYDFEESPSQEEIKEQNPELNEIFKNLEKKNIVKVTKRKAKIEKQKKTKTTVKAKATPKKRKAAEMATTKPAAASKKKKTHNLSVAVDDELHEIGGNEAVTDNDNDDKQSVHSVCSDIIDQHGDVIGLIEKEWSAVQTRTMRPRKMNTDDGTNASRTKVNNSKVKVVDTIEPFVEKPIETPDEQPFPLDMPDLWDTEETLPLKRTLRNTTRNKLIQSTPKPSRAPQEEIVAETSPIQPLKRPLRSIARNKPEQSTPKPVHAKFNGSDIFKNASPLTRNGSIEVTPAMPPSPVDSPAHDSDVESIEITSDVGVNAEENVPELIEPSSPSKFRAHNTYGRSPLKNISNATATNFTSSILFDQQKNSYELNESYSINRRNPIIAQPKSDVRPLDRSVAETKAPALKELFGFDDDIVELESSIEVTLSTTTVSSKSALTKKRESFKRFLKNPKPMVSSTTSPSKRKTPSKIGKSVEIFGGATNAQKDIRDAFQSNTHHMTVDDGPNLFSDTETEISQDRRKSYTRTRIQYKRQLVADSEPEDDEKDEAEEHVEKTKKPKGKPRKKMVDPKEKSTDDEELNKFANEFNTMCEEVERFEVPIVPE